MSSIVIFGLGSIGTRHLQAIATLHLAPLCYDISTQAIAAIPAFLQKNNITLNPILSNNKEEALNAITPETIVIVATTAKGRKDLLLDILKKRPLAIIAEKPLTQTSEEYTAIMQAQETTPVYINFGRHYWQTYQELAQILQQESKITILGKLGNMGFATSGIHFIELATWLFNEQNYTIREMSITNTFETKRPGFFDFSGTVHVQFGEKELFLSLTEKNIMNSLDIIIPTRGWKLLESTGKIISYDKNNITTTPFPIIMISATTGQVVKSIMDRKKPLLPTIAESKTAHDILFAMMKNNNIENLNIT
ncbi:MAG: Gfo/Idh/MocA family oxidoreductase [Nanoarchaeota archaeon]